MPFAVLMGFELSDVQEGRSVFSAQPQGRLTDDAGRLYAHGVTTCMLFRPPSPGAKEG